MNELNQITRKFSKNLSPLIISPNQTGTGWLKPESANHHLHYYKPQWRPQKHHSTKFSEPSARVFFLGDELKFIVVMFAQLFEYTKNHWMYTLNGWIIWYVNYISLKLLFKKFQTLSYKTEVLYFKPKVF